MIPSEQIIVVVTGLGAIIAGLYSLWHIRQSRTIIKVEPYVAVSPPNQDETLGIKVINESQHAVTLTEIGVLYSNTEMRMTTPMPITHDNSKLPYRIGPHSSFQGTFKPGLYKTEPNMVFATHVYAQLSNGETYKKEVHFNPAKERNVRREWGL